MNEIQCQAVLIVFEVEFFKIAWFLKCLKEKKKKGTETLFRMYSISRRRERKKKKSII